MNYQAQRVRNVRKWFAKELGLRPENQERAKWLRQKAAEAEEKASK